MFILSDEVLEKLICSACKKYLSVKPVKIYPDNQIKCGRCTQPDDNGTVSLYGTLAQESLFKCINRFDGCNKLLTYPEVQDHEEQCLSNTYLCPICGPSKEFATFLLPDHFQTHHPNACLGKPEIVIDLSPMETERKYFYKQYDCLFIVNVEVSQIDDIVGFSVDFVGKETAACKILYRLSIYSLPDRRIIRVTGKQSCTALGTREANTTKVKYFDLASANQVLYKLEIDTSMLASLTILPKFLGIPAQDNLEVPYTPKQLEKRLFPTPNLSKKFKAKYPDYFVSDCGLFLKENHKDTDATVTLPLFCAICYGKLAKVFSAVYILTKTEYLCDMCGVVLLRGIPEKFVPHQDIYSEISLMCRWRCGPVNGVNHNCRNHPLRLCPMTDCQQLGTLDKLVSHLRVTHKLTYMADKIHFFTNELWESQNVVLLILNRFVLLEVDITNTTKTFTAKVIDKQYEVMRYTPVIVAVYDFTNPKSFDHKHCFSVDIDSDVCFCVTLRKEQCCDLESKYSNKSSSKMEIV